MAGHPRPVVTTVLAAMIAFGCSAAPRQRPVRMGPTDTGPGTLTAARQYLLGRWTLLSFEVMPPGQPPISVAGAGTLNYDEYGNLDMEVRVDGTTANRLQEVGIRTNGGILSTKGRTVVDMQAKTLTFVIEGQPQGNEPSGPLALNRKRYWEVDGNILTLTTRRDDGQAVSIGRWQRER